ncbi:Lrp/AsnC family transcriptional regulator [Vogesella sp. LIG4]|uniref:Lrp/AsnC family transcriptional regulator n=1 Tax=Vogesella sp. LIG4 TaxID=1192162 RepID=UPI00081FAB17|nr:Lrp/AsnC family transcriptional regulator [Vogesella sp. LIG4]SCK27335.1 transcriptional regulator, AsnC family [Vogesella sp. LIG4]
MKLDTLDHKILDALGADARLPLATLASQLGLSRQSVRQRIDRLEGHKVIAGYTIRRATPEAAEQVRSVLLVYRKDRMRGADVTSAIAKIPEVTSCVVLSGEIDLMVQLNADSHARVNQIWSEISALAGVQNITTCFVLAMLVDRQ